MWTLLNGSFYVGQMCTVYFLKIFISIHFRHFFKCILQYHMSILATMLQVSNYSELLLFHNDIMYTFNDILFYSLRWYYQVSVAYYVIVYSLICLATLYNHSYSTYFLWFSNKYCLIRDLVEFLILSTDRVVCQFLPSVIFCLPNC